MKNVMKKALALCLLAVIAVSGFGCGKKGSDEDTSRETIDINQTKQELTFNYRTGNVADAVEDSSEGDPVEAPESSAADAASTAEAATEIEEVTEFVPVTDDKGQDVTDAKGAVATEPVVKETRAVVVADSKSDNAQQGGDQQGGDQQSNNQQGGGQSNYTPAYDTCKAYWLDMSQMGDYTFNGELLSITFKVNDNVPDGNYPVSISMTDIASWDLVKYEPTKINGELAVNTTPTSQEDMPSDDFALKINSVAAKQGDVATITMDLANNPGFCGFVIDIQYDTNAMTIIDATAGKDFDAAVNLVS
ncbi:MAG: hypothetical protein IKN55_02555 [Oscillospiraceae bacterium]|nr:hypothetical protein [Oscillospiraceae bacterium]